MSGCGGSAPVLAVTLNRTEEMAAVRRCVEKGLFRFNALPFLQGVNVLFWWLSLQFLQCETLKAIWAIALLILYLSSTLCKWDFQQVFTFEIIAFRKSSHRAPLLFCLLSARSEFMPRGVQSGLKTLPKWHFTHQNISLMRVSRMQWFIHFYDVWKLSIKLMLLAVGPLIWI